MSYGRHTQGLYRTGFRPRSDPWAATQLGKTPFDFDLWRLGQVRAFTRSGGYGLHGLGDMVPNGSVVDYTGTWAYSPTGSATPDDMLNAVVAALRADGLTVLNSSSSGGILAELQFWVGGATFTATLRLQVSNGLGFSTPADVASIVDHEAYIVTGSMPSGSQAVTVSVPGPAGTTVIPAAGAGDLSSWLQQNALWVGLAVLGIAVLPDVVRKL